MSEIPQVKAVLAHIEARESEVAEKASLLRDQIDELTARLGEFDRRSISRRGAGTPRLPADSHGRRRHRRPARARDIAVVAGVTRSLHKS